MAKTIRWGILGPGGIAKTFANGVAHSRTGKIVAVGTRNPGKEGLTQNFPGARIHAGYEALLADPEVDAVYIATPHPAHAQWAIKAAEAGKHVLVEKPMALTAFEADAIINAARKAGVFLGEAYMYRPHPQTLKLLEMIRQGTIGDVRLIRSSFGFAMPEFDPKHRLYANDLAGGGILDVGGYVVSVAGMVAGARKPLLEPEGDAAAHNAAGDTPQLPFVEPEVVAGVAHLGRTGVDEWASAVLRYPNGVVAELSCSISLEQDNVLQIFGTEGRIEVKDFWFASGREGGVGEIRVIKKGVEKIVSVVEDRWLYSFQVDAVAEAIHAGRQQFAWPGMDWAESLSTLRVLDKWRQAIGLEYEIEKPQKRTTTLKGDKLAVSDRRIPLRSIPGVQKQASAVALGFEDFRTFSSAAILLDAFYEAGGNMFDTAFIYGGGITEKLFGQWQRARGVRDQSVLIGKGAHSPLCRPEFIASQLTASLDRLQTDYVDIYCMHRDNLDVPVDEFVDAMDAEVKAGRIRGPYGGSNWTMERFDEAIAYAERAGKQRPGVLSNNFALAEMLDPIWAGCVTSSTDRWRKWLTDRQILNLSWSSQARGFFTSRAGRDKRDNEELVRVWYSDRNFERRDRAIELAEKLGMSPIHVALAYVLAQPFPSIPLIGPRTLAELDDSLNAFEIQLPPETIKWLEA